jgi:hypothetical protein
MYNQPHHGEFRAHACRHYVAVHRFHGTVDDQQISVHENTQATGMTASGIDIHQISGEDDAIITRPKIQKTTRIQFIKYLREGFVDVNG